MTSVRTYKQAIAYLKGMEESLESDRSFGFQCFDVKSILALFI